MIIYVTDQFCDLLTGLKESSSSIDIKALETPFSMGLRPPPEPYKLFSDNEVAVKLNPKQSTNPVSIMAYSLVDLQAATGSFSASRLLGQGTIGSVYKAKFADGKVWFLLDTSDCACSCLCVCLLVCVN